MSDNTEIIPKLLEKCLSVEQDEFIKVVVEDGFGFVSAIKREAARQKALETCDELSIVLAPKDSIPITPSLAAEIDLADTFEIIEE